MKSTSDLPQLMYPVMQIDNTIKSCFHSVALLQSCKITSPSLDLQRMHTRVASKQNMTGIRMTYSVNTSYNGTVKFTPTVV